MKVYDKLYIDGAWVGPHGQGQLDVIDSATEEVMASVPAGDAADVDRAVKAAAAAFDGWAATTPEERAKYLHAHRRGPRAPAWTRSPTSSPRGRHAEEAVEA